MNTILRRLIGIWLIMCSSWGLGSLLVLIALHNWPAWPGVAWFLLGTAGAALGAYIVFCGD